MVQETEFIWQDGKFIKWKQANVHILTHALHYGSGVFEGIRCYDTDKGPAVFRLKEHIDRLFASAKKIHLKIPFTKQQLTKATLELIKKNKIKACYIRPIAYHGYGVMGLDTRKSPVHVAIIVWPWGTYLGEDALDKGVNILVASHRREINEFAGAKITGFYYNSIVSKREAISKGYDEALLLDTKGNIAEGSGENFFIVKDNILITPSKGALLPGITRDSVMRIAKDLKITVQERPITLKEAYLADEAFFTGTAAELTPIARINKKIIGTQRPITKQLQRIYFNTVNAKEKKYQKWLSFVK